MSGRKEGTIADGADTKFTLSLSSTSKALLSISAQTDIDDGTVFTQERYDAFAQMAENAEKKRDSFVRSLIVFDAVVVLLSLGQAIQIPGVDLPLDKVLGAIEIATVLSAIAFYYSVASFFDAQIYDALLSQFDIRRVQYNGMDPELLTASKRFMHLHLKFARVKQNIWGNDSSYRGLGQNVFLRFKPSQRCLLS